MATPSQWELDGTFLENITLTVGAEGSNLINVVVSATQVSGGLFPNKVRPKLTVYVSDNDDGSTITTAAPDTLAIKTGGRGTLTEHVANTVGTVELDANGKADIEFGENGTPTWYLVIVKPDGTLLVSDAITFA